MPGPRGALLVALVLAALVASFFVGGKRSTDTSAPSTFDYYVLVLGWSPSYCLSEGRARHDRQCDSSRAFVLHGLWPQYQKGWPENCHTAKRPWVSQQVIERMRDIMPSKNLMIHEYRTHGTCSGLDPAQYFAVARRLYERVSVPAWFLAGDADRISSPGEIEREFLGANPWLTPDMISIACRGATLLDIRVCFSRDLSA
jgi:ribonuclease T2